MTTLFDLTNHLAKCGRRTIARSEAGIGEAGRREAAQVMTIIISSSRLEKKRREAVRCRTIVDRHRYFQGVAQARFVLRKVFRLIEEQAKLAGLDPLEHQALIQIYGSPLKRLRVKEVAERLDIVPAFASGLVKSLEGKGFGWRIFGFAGLRLRGAGGE